jgi:FkbH-like protein
VEAESGDQPSSQAQWVPEGPVSDAAALLTATRQIRTLRELQSAVAQLEAFPDSSLRGIAEFPARVAILGNFSTQFVAGSMRLALLHRSVLADIFEAPFDQWERLLLDPDSELFDFCPDVTLLLLTSLDAASNLDARVESAVRKAQTTGLKRIVVVRTEPHAQDLSLAPVAAMVSPSAWFAERFWLTAKLPFHPDHTGPVVRLLSGIVRNYISLLVKVVVTDLDQVLWGGVVGELGPDGIELAEDRHLRLQRFLRGLRDRGVLLAVSSANNEADALEPFKVRPDMVLRRSDFSVFVANWEPKPVHLQRIAAELNIGLQNICFLDDSRFERDRVHAVLPEVIVPALPREHEHIVPFLEASGHLAVPVTTEEDARRAELVGLEAIRTAHRDRTGTLEEYYRSLGLILSPVPAHEGVMDRVIQLIHKTNQFNVTSRRHDRATVEAWIADPSVYCTVFDLVDRYGPYGLIGVLIAVPAGAGYVVDTWLLSCRAMGRTVERGMFAHLAGWLQGRGVKILEGEYVPTRKNAPVKDLFPSLGFEPSDDTGHRFVWSVAPLSAGWNAYVTVADDES